MHTCRLHGSQCQHARLPLSDERRAPHFIQFCGCPQLATTGLLLYIHINTYTCIHMYIYKHIYIYVCMFICEKICICIQSAPQGAQFCGFSELAAMCFFIYKHMYVCMIYIYIGVYVCIQTHLYIRTYPYIYTYRYIYI